MNRKILGTILGVAAALLWFMPLAYVNFGGRDAYQAGNHIGGIAYPLLIASMAYAALSWMELHVPRIIAASVALAISLLFLVQAGTSTAWGLIGLIAVNGACIAVAFRDNRVATVQTPEKSIGD